MPRLIVPSSGGGTKLMRTLLAGDAEGVCSGVGEGEADSFVVGEGVGVSESCAIAPQMEAKAIRSATLSFFVIPSVVEESLTPLFWHSNDKNVGAARVRITSNVIPPV